MKIQIIIAAFFLSGLLSAATKPVSLICGSDLSETQFYVTRNAINKMLYTVKALRGYVKYVGYNEHYVITAQNLLYGVDCEFFGDIGSSLEVECYAESGKKVFFFKHDKAFFMEDNKEVTIREECKLER